MHPELLKKVLEALTAGDAAAALELLKEIVASAVAGDAGEPAADPSVNALAESAAAPAATTDPAAQDDKAMASALRQITCRQSAGEAIAALKEMYGTVQSLNADHARVDNASRIELVGDLVKLGVETPATAWEGEPENMKPVARLSAEPVESMRNRIAILRKSRPAEDESPKRPTAVLSAADQKRADAIQDPTHRARFIERRLGRS